MLKNSKLYHGFEIPPTLTDLCHRWFLDFQDMSIKYLYNAILGKMPQHNTYGQKKYTWCLKLYVSFIQHFFVCKVRAKFHVYLVLATATKKWAAYICLARSLPVSVSCKTELRMKQIIFIFKSRIQETLNQPRCQFSDLPFTACSACPALSCPVISC